MTAVWPDDESKQMFDVRNKAALYLNDGDYDSLDKLASDFRSSKECYANGLWDLYEVYVGLSPSDKASDEEWENVITNLQNWVNSKPESITARVGLASVLIDYAWKARGGDWAYKVSDNSWKLFGERLNKAAEILDQAKDLKESCPIYWTAKMRVALGLQLNKSQLNDIFEDGVNHFPDYEGYYMRKANYLMPRWSGDIGELEADLEKSADKLGGDDGDMLYARVVWSIHGSGSSDNIIKENGFSWQRANRGFNVIEKRFPNSLAAISEHAYLAAYAGDASTARECLKKTGGKADLAIFYYKEEYIRVANWTFEN